MAWSRSSFHYLVLTGPGPVNMEPLGGSPHKSSGAVYLFLFKGFGFGLAIVRV